MSKTKTKKQYTHLEMEAALCVWEWINDVTLLDDERMKRPAWIELREGVGAVEMRHQSIALGKWCLEIYDILTAHNELFFDGISYDWEVIPMFMDYAEDSEGAPVIYKEALPDPHKVAQMVAHRHLLKEYVQSCVNEASTQWGYAELISDDMDRTVQAFTLGEDPKDFVRWLGEKRDLNDPGPWR